MALVDYDFLSVTLGMSNKKTSTVRWRVTAVNSRLYHAEITQTLKDGTPVGLMMLSIEDLSAGNLIKKGVILDTVDDAADYPVPANKVFAFDKLSVHFQASYDNYEVTIPGRDNAKFTLADDGETVITGAGATTEVANFVSRFNTTVLGKNGGQGTVTLINVLA